MIAFLNSGTRNENSFLIQLYAKKITHLYSVIMDHYKVIEALTIGGDHCTTCGWCSRNVPDECFWIITSINMGMLGRQVKHGRQMRNNQVQHFLYKDFIKEEYVYLREVVDDEPVRVEEHNGLPCMPLPCSINNEMKRMFPNEDAGCLLVL